MKFLDMFAGIGGFRFAMEQAGHECVGFCEIDKFARASYKAIHDTKGEIELHDVTQVTEEEIRNIGTVDVICGGFPCQAFSIAGTRRGFEDTRGTLFFEVARFASILKPKYLFLENVKGLLNHDNGNTFEVIISTLDELGYNVEWQVLNSKDFGVPQNRERVFIIASLRGECTRRVFPIGRKGAKFIAGKQIAIPVLTPERVNKRQNGRRFKEDGEPMFTLTAQDKHGIMIHKRIRTLTPRECWRLQGYPDWAFEKAQQVNSNSQLYKQAGNSVTVNVVAEIAKRL